MSEDAAAQRPPTDPDIDLRLPQQRAELPRTPWTVLGVIAVGGAIGALARYGIGYALPAAPTGFPWATSAINVFGCLLIGALMVLVTGRYRNQPLVRPFFGVGILGGFTTFSTYVVDIQRLLQASAPVTALAYLLGTLLSALAAAEVGTLLARWATRSSGRAR